MIELRNVSKTVISGTEPLTIVRPVNLSVASGQYLSIVGPSGSGKSTLLGLIAGLDVPTTGENRHRRGGDYRPGRGRTGPAPG